MKFQIKRLWSQVVLLIAANLGAIHIKTGFCYPFFYCHACPTASAACPLRAIETSVFRGHPNWRLLIYPLAIIGTIGVIFGRAACGWACPIGLLQRATGKIPRKLKKISLIQKLGKSRFERPLRYSKYLILLGLVVATPIFIGFMFTDICPVGFLTGTIPILLLNPLQYVPNVFFYPALVIFILFILLILLVERGWCRYFCPVGALLAPFNKISVFHVAVNKSECVHCNLCSQICPMGIDIPNMERDPECILCGKCVHVCPHNLIEFKRN